MSHHWAEVVGGAKSTRSDASVAGALGRQWHRRFSTLCLYRAPPASMPPSFCLCVPGHHAHQASAVLLPQLFHGNLGLSGEMNASSTSCALTVVAPMALCPGRSETGQMRG